MAQCCRTAFCRWVQLLYRSSESPVVRSIKGKYNVRLGQRAGAGASGAGLGVCVIIIGGIVYDTRIGYASLKM